MERKQFFTKAFTFLSLVSISAFIRACKKTSGNGASASSSTDGTCTVTNSETDGPYPLYTERGAGMVRSDITEGTKTGTALNINLTILSKKNNCLALPGLLVDIWHCDKDGYYSGYPNQQGYLGVKDYTGSTWLRGQQTTDSNGKVSFISIFPGWYVGRVTHIHVEIYTASNGSNEGSSNTLLTTQIAFPVDITQSVYNTSLYSAHGQNPTTFATDSVFSDGTTTEMASIASDASTGGYNLSLSITVDA